jgi:hypothetical protein
MVERKFQLIDKYVFNRTYHGIPLSEQWQAWETAHFFRVKSIIDNPSVAARLISYGCNNGDPSTLNCTTTCSNATLMYSLPENLWNCMTLATLGMLVGPGNDTIDRGSEMKMDAIFHFGTVEKFNRLNVFRKARDCAWASCSDSTYGHCTGSLQRFKCNPVSPTNIESFGNVMAKPYCQVASAGIDLDIAGQGVRHYNLHNLVSSDHLTDRVSVYHLTRPRPVPQHMFQTHSILDPNIRPHIQFCPKRLFISRDM